MGWPKGSDSHPKWVGDQATAMVLAHLLRVHRNVLIPFGENSRYDLVIEEETRFVRVQCKAGRVRNGVIRFNTCSTTYHHPGNQGTKAYHHHYRGAADLFGVYCPETDRVYLVPVDDVPTREGMLRIEPTLNNQAKKVRWAHEYELKLPG
jgi:hypothetical protein